MKTFLLLCLVLANYSMFAQDGSHQMVNKLPDFIPPTPEAAGIIKADQLSVGYVTGSPNISIPLATLQSGGYSLGLSLSYSSTGIKVDEYASMVGMGWNFTYGGVITRAVMDKPDESRSPGNHSFSNLNMNNLNATLLNFLNNALDKEIDIFTFSLPGYSGKFILDSSYQPVQLARNNLKIEVISGSFQNGFIITTNDGTAYHFQDPEISTSRNPSGDNCEKTNDATSTKTSWYLTKIVLPSTQKQINFTYTTASITFESSISQTISRVIASDTYPCTGVTACPLGTERFSTCISQQVVTSKFITKIETSDGDKIEFTYNGTSRTDLQNGKRLTSFKMTNRNGRIIREVTFASAYQNASTGSSQYRNNRLFLDSVMVKGGELSSVSGPLTYRFKYIGYTDLPSRLSYAQDWYGYYNGKTSNASLIPILTSTDVNYSTFNSGTGATSVNFGDRSIDTVYCLKGLLNRITYPTGGYDTIVYRAARHSSNQLAGGNAVSKIISYTDAGSKALEREFLYINKSDSTLSAYLLTNEMIFSQQHTTKRNYFTNSCGTFPSGPACTYAVVTSNSNNPITTFGSQHIYYKSVLEIVKGASTDNGMTEHIYRLFSFLEPRHWIGNYVLNCPYQVLPDLVLGELKTNVYKRSGSSYNLLKSAERILRLDTLYEYHSYSVKKNYEYGTASTPPASAEFDPFDVDEYYINVFTVLTDTIIEKEYADGGLIMTKLTKQEFANPAYTYPTRITTAGSDGLELKIERKYSPDYAGYTFMTNRNITAPVLEEKQYKNSSLVATLTHKFKDWFSNATVIAPDTSDLKYGASSQVQRILYHGYDTHGNVNEVSKEGDERLSYIWDYNKNYAIAKVQNATSGSIAYTSFEADGTGGWTRSGSVIDTCGITGRKSFNGTVSKTVSSGNYIVTAWTKTSASLSVNSTSGTQIIIIGNWKLLEWNLSSVTSISVTGTCFDEVRLYPKGAIMTTFCYEPQIGVTVQCDVNNRLIFYEYDGLGRLMLVRDQDRNILKKLCYNYAGQPEACSVYYNVDTCQLFTKDCGVDSVGSSVTYCVPAGRYSGYSQADANAKAVQEMSALGQANANAKGTCALLCTTSNCTGADKKCVNNICETGVRVFTSSTQLGLHMYECTYHYEWSDGSWSQNYTDIFTQPCAID
jgi:hypothetical protein